MLVHRVMLPFASLQFAFDQCRKSFHPTSLKPAAEDLFHGAAFSSIKLCRAVYPAPIGTNTNPLTVISAHAAKTGFHRLLPLHFNFCLTTLKNEASGSDANGSVFFALRMVTTDPRSTWIGFRPSKVRNTG